MPGEFPGSRSKLSQIAARDLRKSYHTESLQRYLKKTKIAGAISFSQ